MVTKHTHREYGNDNYSYEYRYEYDKSNRFAKISVYRYNGGWYLYSYWTAKESGQPGPAFPSSGNTTARTKLPASST